jgi:glycosyltransferase involved in cell wall biosynthesis
LSLLDLLRIDKLLKINKDIDIVFLDVSVFGRIAQMIKKKYPSIKVVVNFHNNESKYYRDMVRVRGWEYLPFLLSVAYNERLSCRNSDLNIFLTNEDKKSIDANSVSSIIIPVTIKDNFNYTVRQNTVKARNYILFTGIAYYANLHGVQYLIEKIAPYVSCDIVIAGKGMRIALSKIKMPGNVIIRDFMNDLSEMYYGASAFIAPLFYGSGMKVKIAEALMYGKKIIATPLAYYGYEIDNSSCAVCNIAEEFIAEINNLTPGKTFYEESRFLFLKHYSSSNNDTYYSQIDDYITT